MARYLGKTPDDLFKQIKPEAYVGRGSRINAPKDKLPENGVSPLYYGNRVTYTKLYNGIPSQAQKAANEEGAIYGTHNPEKYYLRFNSNKKINPYPRSNHGSYGQIRLPEQWKYKTGTELATAMTRAANYDPDDERSWGPSPYARQVEDIWDEIYSAKMEEPKKID